MYYWWCLLDLALANLGATDDADLWTLADMGDTDDADVDAGVLTDAVRGHAWRVPCSFRRLK